MNLKIQLKVCLNINNLKTKIAKRKIAAKFLDQKL